MLQTPMELVGKYEGALAAEGVDRGKWRYYQRWLRFFLDYCGKYGAAPLDPASLRAFDLKLRDKGQGELFRRQAAESVRIYWEMTATKASPSGAAQSSAIADASRSAASAAAMPPAEVTSSGAPSSPPPAPLPRYSSKWGHSKLFGLRVQYTAS